MKNKKNVSATNKLVVQTEASMLKAGAEDNKQDWQGEKDINNDILEKHGLLTPADIAPA